jgi:hypothetical protein
VVTVEWWRRRCGKSASGEGSGDDRMASGGGSCAAAEWLSTAVMVCGGRCGVVDGGCRSTVAISTVRVAVCPAAVRGSRISARALQRRCYHNIIIVHRV